MNNLPQMFAELSDSGGHLVATEQNTPGGWTLEQHSHDSTSLALIAEGGWNYVVLQEESQIPSIPRLRDSSMYPAIRRLDSLIHDAGCRTALYMTWGWKYGGIQVVDGDSSPPFRDYFEMQDSVTAAYQRIAAEISALLLPAGEGWDRARCLDSLVNLWQADSEHATVEGSYLSACVFYAAFFHATPVGNPFYAGLDTADAVFCQRVAAWVVLGIGERPGSSLASPMSISASPNPFARVATLRFSLGRSERTDVEVFDAGGRKVRTLSDGILASGCHSIAWDARDNQGKQVSAGIYIVQVRSSEQTLSQKLILVRR
jgi:hypothetical protein